jgi:hypothetical protein
MDPLIVGTAFVTFLTEAASWVAAKFGTKLPPIAKQGLALVLATGAVSLNFIVVKTPLPAPVNQFLTGLSIWFLAMVLHDKALRPA